MVGHQDARARLKSLSFIRAWVTSGQPVAGTVMLAVLDRGAGRGVGGCVQRWKSLGFGIQGACRLAGLVFGVDLKVCVADDAYGHASAMIRLSLAVCKQSVNGGALA